MRVGKGNVCLSILHLVSVNENEMEMQFWKLFEIKNCLHHSFVLRIFLTWDIYQRLGRLDADFHEIRPALFFILFFHFTKVEERLFLELPEIEGGDKTSASLATYTPVKCISSCLSLHHISIQFLVRLNYVRG